jgi:isoleucyl-tRNA synthetase
LGRTETVRTTISLALNLRERAGHRVRQPLRRMFVVGDAEAREALDQQRDHVMSELNVKGLVISDGAAEFMRREVGLDFKKAGPILRKDVGRVKGLLGKLTAEQHASVASVALTGAAVTLPDGTQVPAEVLVVTEVAGDGVEVATESGLTVALDTDLDEPLEREGLVRDLMRKIQVMRKEAGLEVSDRILLQLATDSEVLALGLSEHGAVIADEVLADSVGADALDGAAACETWDIGGHSVTASLARA